MAERYIVTGAGGFIGARFVEAARERGVQVVSVDVKTQSENVFTSRPEHSALDFGLTLDIAELEPWLASESSKGISAVIHLGACSDTMELDEAVHERLNVEYTKMLWTWCGNNSVPLVYASSAATYGDGTAGYDDDEARMGLLQPLNPYGWSKQRVDLWALEREKANSHPPIWAGFKFFNVYGFGERHKARMSSVVLHASDQVRRTNRVSLFRSYKEGVGDGQQARDFIYVADVVDVLFFAAKGGIKRGIYNLGTGRARTFSDLARATFDAYRMPASIDFIDVPDSLRDRYQYFTEANVCRLRSAGYSKPFTELEAGIAEYIKRLARHRDEGGLT